MACKGEGEMLQIELYVADLERTRQLFTSIFGFCVIEEKPGWRHLRHSANYDIMLFAPAQNRHGESHWALPTPGTGGTGIEIVICTRNVKQKLQSVRENGYKCTDLRYPPWGSIEFIFQLEEGYLLRIKQPPALSDSDTH
jgi:catechol 2,3-dioxygenase-like lactoylglutathione lyase family enzyme